MNEKQDSFVSKSIGLTESARASGEKLISKVTDHRIGWGTCTNQSLRQGLNPISMPLERVASVHLSGGHWETGSDGHSRLIDDHIHDPPESVYELLEVLAFKAPQPLTVTIERDGHYPDFEALLKQMRKARSALATGRARRELTRRKVA